MTTFVTALYAIAGLGLYVIARFVNVRMAIVIVVILAVPSLVAVVVGLILGARTPRLTANLIQLWWLLALCLGALVGVIALGTSTLVAIAEGPKPDPEAKVVLDQVAAIVIALVALAAGAFGSSSRSWLSKLLIGMRYGPLPQFQALPSSQPDMDAYYAITRGDGSTRFATFSGWNRKDTEVRLNAIHAALWP